MTEALAQKATEADPVLEWRLEVLIRAGYAPDDALVLSGHSDVELHTAVDLLRAGCPAQIALRILL
jgi:hypothetical protein